MMMMIGFQLITRKYSVAVATRIYILRGIWNIGGGIIRFRLVYREQN